MRTGVIAKKLGMSLLFDKSGKKESITLLQIENCQVVAHKTLDRDGYEALVVGSGEKKISKVSKPMKQMFIKSKIAPKIVLKEFRIASANFLEIGTDITAEHFTVGQFVDISGKTIGKGFAGSMKRHNFAGLEASHGVSISHRAHGSTGGRQDPGRVFKNKKMAGHMGDSNVTLQNLSVVGVDPERNILMIKGAVPGSKGKYVYVKDAIKKTIAH